MRPDTPWCSPALRLMRTRMETTRGLRLVNREKLRELVRAHCDEVAVFTAHEPVQLRVARRTGEAVS
jgi:hypothetical protein